MQYSLKMIKNLKICCLLIPFLRILCIKISYVRLTQLRLKSLWDKYKSSVLQIKFSTICLIKIYTKKLKIQAIINIFLYIRV